MSGRSAILRINISDTKGGAREIIIHMVKPHAYWLEKFIL